MNNDDQSKLNRLLNNLYSRKHPPGLNSERSGIHEGEKKIEVGWKSEQETPLREAFQKNEAVKKDRFLGKLFVFAILFFIISIGIAAAVFFGGFNRISPNNVNISVLGPLSVAAGDELSLDIIVNNGNAIDLSNVVLTIHYPDGTRSAANTTLPLTIDTEQVGAIRAGQSVTKTVKAVLFGEKDAIQNITVTADYNIQLSTSPNHKEKQYQIAIKSAPVIMTVNYPKEINSGHTAQFDIDITSNTNSPINNLVLTGIYPFGFTFTSSDPAPYSGNAIWHLGTLMPLEKRHITIIGTLDAQNNEERTFSFDAGTALPDDDRKIGVTLASAMQSLTVLKPEIGLSVVFQGDNANPVIKYSDFARLSINWKNNLSISLENIQISAKMSGSMLDESAVSPGASGFYRSIDNTAYWDKSTTPNLEEALPGANSSVGIGVGALKNFLISKITDPEIIFDVSISGSRLDAGGVPETITSKAQEIIKIQTQPSISQRLAYSSGPFKNTGPIPPKVDTESTYTVFWDASNTLSNISGGKMVATLPSYIEWKGAINPANAPITFDPNTRQITWNLGTLPRGAGTLTLQKEVAFQIGFVPSISQLGNKVTMVNPASFSGEDDFAKITVEAQTDSLTSFITGDPVYSGNNGTVVN